MDDTLISIEEGEVFKHFKLNFLLNNVSSINNTLAQRFSDILPTWDYCLWIHWLNSDFDRKAVARKGQRLSPIDNGTTYQCSCLFVVD